VARFDLGTDTNHAVWTEVLERFITEVRDVTGDFLRPELGIAGADLEFVDVNGGKDVFFDNALADKDGVFKVVTVPGHERDEHVTAQSQLTALRAGAVRDDLSFFDGITFPDDDFLVDASGGIGPHEFADLINPNPLFRVVPNLFLGIRQFPILRDDDLVADDGGDLSGFIRDDDGARVARDAFLQSSRHQRRFGAQQRHSLALH